MLLFDNPFDAVSLPQDDKHPERRAAQLQAAQDAYAYSYSKANLRGVAMVADPPKSSRPDAAWLGDVLEVVGKVIDNAGRLSEAEGATPASQLAALIEDIRASGIAKAFADLGEAVTRGRETGPVMRLAEYAELFQAWPLPSVATEHYLDSTFARMRVAGYNPAWLRRVDPSVGLPDDFGVTAAHYRAAIDDDGDSLEAALKEGRLFGCEYRELLDCKPGSNPVPAKIEIDYATDPSGWDAAYAARQAQYADTGAAKLLVSPLALFTIPRGSGALAPVAIQLFPNGAGGQTYPVFTPRDGLTWLAAKMAVDAADGNVHEAISHLGLTHLVQEAFLLAMHNCLAHDHPLHRLLAPHFEGTVAINAAADQSLVAPAGAVDALMIPTIGDTIRVSATALRNYDFNAQMFPNQLRSRGVDDAELLRDYPYRDDGQLVWSALEIWVRDYVHHYYADDAAVAADVELQNFVVQVGQYRAEDARGRLVGGGIRGVGEAGSSVQTRAYLISMLTQIIWNGSAQHAAVNFAQAQPMAYVPMVSLALLGKQLPAGTVSEADILRLISPRELAHQQLVIAKLLGSVYHTKLGHYSEGPLPRSYFGRGAIRDFEQALQRRLDDVERTIDERNLTRPAYRYLRPSEIPQSINI